MRGGLDKVQVRVPEQPGQMACEIGVEVAVGRAENERDGQVEGRQLPSGDVGILLIERGNLPGPGRRVGLFFMNSREARTSEASYDRALAERLWTFSAHLVGLP